MPTTKPLPAPLVTVALIAAGCAFREPNQTMTPEQIRQIERIGIGEWRTTPIAQDVPLVLQALTGPDGGAASRACLAVEKMAGRGLFDAPSAEAALRALLPKLRGPDDNTSEWSARAIGSLASDTPF